MKKTVIFVRNYKYEFLAFLVDAVIIFATFLLASQIVVFFVSLGVITLSTFVLVYFKTKDKDFYYYPFDVPGQEQDWVGRGDLKYIRNEKCFEITNSHVGYILPRTSNWDDYRYEMDFKIVTSSLGVIVRAVNLSNYLMYQISHSGIKPHLRINGSWIVMDVDILEQKLFPDNWYKLVVYCEKRNIRLQIKKQREVINDRQFKIPEQIVVMKKELDSSGKETGGETRFLQYIDFDFGSAGVRNHGDERALIRDILIEKL